MKSLTIAPPETLRRYVQLFWCLELESPEEFGPVDRIAPDGIVELVLQYRPGISIRLDGDDFGGLTRSALVCQTSRFAEIRASAAVGFVSVRFRPWGAIHFFDMPVSEIADQVVPARAVWGSTLDELEESVLSAPTMAGRVAAIESFLIDRLARHHKDEVEAVLRPVWQLGGNLRVDELCRALGVSDRTAQRLFHRCVGMPPKRYAKLVRFLTACAAIRRSEPRTLSEVAHRCGYYDHAHFDADFRAFGGMTPSEFAGGQALSFLEFE